MTTPPARGDVTQPVHARLCALDGCQADLDALGLRASARYCSVAHKASAARQRQAAQETERERVRAVRRAAAARRRAERQRLQAEEQHRREAERAELERLRAEVERLRRHASAGALLPLSSL